MREKIHRRQPLNQFNGSRQLSIQPFYHSYSCKRRVLWTDGDRLPCKTEIHFSRNIFTSFIWRAKYFLIFFSHFCRAKKHIFYRFRKHFVYLFYAHKLEFFRIKHFHLGNWKKNSRVFFNFIFLSSLFEDEFGLFLGRNESIKNYGN